jgi:pentatricopeptide repeat protein
VLDFLAPTAFGYRLGSSKVPLVPKPSKRHNTERLAEFPVSVRTQIPAILCENIKQRISLLSQPGAAAVSDPDINFFDEKVVELRRALKAGDIARVGELWSQLEDRKLLRLLGPELRVFSERATQLCFTDNSEPWVADEGKIIEGMAIAAACEGAVNALKTCMITHIKRGDSQAALSLYRRFLVHSSNQTASEPLPSSTQEDIEDVNGLALNFLGDQPSHQPNFSLVLAAIAAHALEDSFEGALKIMLDNPVRINQFIQKEFLASFDNFSFRAKVQSYIHRLDIARLISRHHSLSTHIANLSSNQDLSQIQVLYQAIIKGLNDPEPYLAARDSQKSRQRPVVIQEINWAAFLTGFLQCNRRDLAENLWNDMLNHGIQPGVITWTALLDGFDSMGEADAASTSWDNMVSQGIRPGILTYRAIISTLFNARRPADAIEKFAVFKRELANGSLSDTGDALPVYNTVLHGLLNNGRPGDADALLQDLRQKGPKPDIVSYNTFLRHHGRRGEFRAVSVLLERLREDGLTGDAFTFSSVLSALLKVGRTDAIDIILSLMKKQNVEPNVAVFSAIIDQQLRESSEQGLRTAMELLQKMETNPDAQPNDVTYTGVLASLHRQVWPDTVLAEECRRNVLKRMKERNIRPNRVTYHILIKACLENPEAEGLQGALGYYREMANRKVPMNYDTWYILLHGLISREEWAVADEMVEDLLRYIKPVGALESLIGRIQRRTAYNIIRIIHCEKNNHAKGFSPMKNDLPRPTRV